MIPVETQQRLMNSIPDRINASYSSSSGVKEVELVLRDGDETTPDHLYWEFVGGEPNYPVVVLNLNPTGVLRSDERTLDSLLWSEVTDESTGTLTEYHGEPMYDELSVTFAMDEQNTNWFDNDAFETAITRLQPAKVAKTVVSELYAHFHRVDLNYPGDDFEYPVRLEPISGPSNVTRTAFGEATPTEVDIERWQFTFRVHYTMSWQVVVESANRLNIDVSLDVNADGETDTTRNYDIDLSSD